MPLPNSGTRRIIQDTRDVLKAELWRFANIYPKPVHPRDAVLQAHVLEALNTAIAAIQNHLDIRDHEAAE